MLNKIISLFGHRNYVGVFIISFTLFPFIILCLFNVPLGDDFWYGASFRDNGFIATQIKWYNEWSGRYMATFAISTLNPVALGHLNLGVIHPLLLIVGTVFSLRLLINNIIDTFDLQLNKLIVLGVFLFFYFNYIPDFGETFYWMAGAYTYQLPIIFFLLYLNTLINLFKSENSLSNIKNIVFGILCLLIILGSNEVIVLYTCFVNGSILLALFFKNKNLILRFLPFFIITLFLSIFMIFAPGNFGREALFDKTDFHVVKTIIESFSRGGFMLFFWLPTITLLMILIPDIHKINIIQTSYNNYFLKFNSKVIFIGLLFLLIIAFIGFFPSIYTTKWIPQRAYTPIFFILMVVSTILIFFAIIKVKVLNDLNKILSTKSINPLLLIITIIVLSHNSNVMNAYVDISSGKAIAYHKQVISTYHKLKSTDNKEVFYVQELQKKPLILPIRWPSKHNRLVNNEWEEYFKIEKIEMN